LARAAAGLFPSGLRRSRPIAPDGGQGNGPVVEEGRGMDL